MKPCPFFLEGKCRFDEQSCKFSHGHVVPFSELRPFQDPDFRSVLAPDSLSGSFTWWGGEGDRLTLGWPDISTLDTITVWLMRRSRNLWTTMTRAYEPLHDAYKLLEGEWEGGGKTEDQVSYKKLWSWQIGRFTFWAFKFDQYFVHKHFFLFYIHACAALLMWVESVLQNTQMDCGILPL